MCMYVCFSSVVHPPPFPLSSYELLLLLCVLLLVIPQTVTAPATHVDTMPILIPPVRYLGPSCLPACLPVLSQMPDHTHAHTLTGQVKSEA
ncbi:hypothetical protein B0T26DRAFT_712943, partial [Lasiosphaeria miniovina]